LRDEFHVALAELSKNPVLQLFVDVLMRLTKRHVRKSRAASAGEAIEAIEASEHLRRMRNDHSEIVAAVTAGDTARAKTLTERHVQAVTSWLHKHQCADRAGRTPAPRRTPLPAGEPSGEAPHGKLAELLAATIGDDIVTSGRQVGSVFGTETALLERYRVSRSVLREAVRLLEYHSVAQMRRGPGGGLIVTEPEAQASIDTIALYLQFRRPSREDLRCVRDAIEIDGVAKVADRRHETDVADFLETHCRGPAFGAGPRVSADDLRKASLEEFRFHVGLAQLAGNAVLNLFLRIIVELFRRHWSSTGQALPTWTDVVAVQHAHQRILEAISVGDDSLARYRIRRHLDAAASWWL
jgi:DNA-binding FadR family transcriptional regulator